jgi:hypothetical protein
MPWLQIFSQFFEFSGRSLCFREALKRIQSTFESVRIDALARRFRPADEGLRLSSRF